MSNKTTLEIRLDDLRKATEDLFWFGGKRERNRPAQAELLALFIRIFNTLHDRLRILDWKNDAIVNNTLRPYLNGLPEERARYLEIIGNKLQDPADKWQRFIKQLQANLNGLREEKQTEIAHCHEELATGNEIANHAKQHGGTEAVLHDLENWPVDDTTGNEVKDRLVRALRGLLAGENVRTLGCLRLAVMAAIEKQRTIVCLRGELAAAEALLTEAAQTTPAIAAETLSPLDESDGEGAARLANIITERVDDLATALELLVDELDEHEQNSLGLVSLIAEAERRLNEEAAKRKLISEKSDHKKIEAWTAKARAQIEQIRARQIATEQIIAPLTQHKQRLVSELAALRTVLGCLTTEVGLHNTVCLPPWDEPNLEILFAEKTEMGEGAERDKHILVQPPVKPHEVPSTTDTSTTDLDKATVRPVREFEVFLQNFTGLEETEIRERLPYEPPENYATYYNLLISHLQRGDFLPAAQMAFVVLNAARRDDQPTARLSKTVMALMKAKGVKLSSFTGNEATDAGRALGLIHILGLIDPRWRLINRIRTGSRWGLGNQLTELGLVFAKVWTDDLLTMGRINRNQLNGIAQTIRKWDQREDDKKKTGRT